MLTIDYCSNICTAVNQESRYTWKPCLGSINPETDRIGFMCETEGGRVYVTSNSGQTIFYIEYVEGDNNPFSDYGRHVVKFESVTHSCYDVPAIIMHADKNADKYV